MNMDVRPVQRRLDDVKTVIGGCLLASGVMREDVDALLATAEADSTHPHHAWWQTVLSRPSNNN
jgi:hypothetical protein